MRSSLALALALAALSVAGACGETEDKARECTSEAPANVAELPLRPLTVGDLDDDEDAVQPWQSGDEVLAVWGSQGLVMLTPYVELPAEAGDPEQACWCVSGYLVEEGVNDELEWTGGPCQAVVFKHHGGVMRTDGVVYAIIGESTPPLGEPLPYRVVVVGENFRAIKELELVLTL